MFSSDTRHKIREISPRSAVAEFDRLFQNVTQGQNVTWENSRLFSLGPLFRAGSKQEEAATPFMAP